MRRYGCSAEEDEDGESEILFCVLDADATYVDGAPALLRLHILRDLGWPEGTMIQYGEGSRASV